MVPWQLSFGSSGRFGFLWSQATTLKKHRIELWLLYLESSCIFLNINLILEAPLHPSILQFHAIIQFLDTYSPSLQESQHSPLTPNTANTSSFTPLLCSAIFHAKVSQRACPATSRSETQSFQSTYGWIHLGSISASWLLGISSVLMSIVGISLEEIGYLYFPHLYRVWLLTWEVI